MKMTTQPACLISICFASHVLPTILIFSNIPLPSTAFAPTIRHNANSRKSPSHSALKAMIFYPEGDGGPSSDDEAYTSWNAFSPALQQDQEELADKLTSRQRTLATLASAFSPLDYSIDLKHISSVRCALLDSKHVEIETIVCDNVECNSLLVPVDFPKECFWDGHGDTRKFEECVMNNVQWLDQEGERRLCQEKAFADPEAELAYETLQSATTLLQDAPSSFPEWWIPPTTEVDVLECDLLQELLNGEDMLDTRMDLVRLSPFPKSDWSHIQWAKILAIGPMGLMLEVVSVNAEGGQNNAIAVDTIPIKFSEGACSIREKVLRFVSSVNVN